DNISDRSSFRDSRKYLKSMETLKYDSIEPKKDRAISSFRVIEESDLYRPVFIERDEEATTLRNKYLNKIMGDLSRKAFDQNYKLGFQQHIISVPHYYTEDLLTINEFEENILVVNANEANEYYNEKTGFIRQRDEESIMII